MNPRPVFLALALILGAVPIAALRADDLDITGDLITFGALTGNSGLAGATLQFNDLDNGDDSYTANLYSILARPQAQWLWSRAADSSGETTLPVMKLDVQGRLNLYDPATAATSQVEPTVSLAPGVQGGVQVSKLPRLELSNQTLDTDNSVVTKILGDERYIRAAASNQSLALATGINVNTGGSGSSNTVPANAAAIGQNLQVSSGQVMVGRYNSAASNAVFVVGAGTSSTQTQNALSVSDSGDTTVGGNLTVTGETTLADATVSGTLSVAGSPVLTQAAAASTYVNKSADSLAMGTDAIAAGGGWALGAYSIAAGNAVSIGTWAGNNGGAASGESSISLGYGAHGYGTGAISMGGYNWAAGTDTVSIGTFSYASSVNSIAIGKSVITYRWGQVVLGTFNTYTESYTNTAQPTDEIFIIGNGASDTERSNAFVIKRNGDASIFGNLTTVQSSRVQSSFVVEGQLDPADATDRTVIAKPSQEVLVPEQGDISMGEFRSGSLPVSQ